MILCYASNTRNDTLQLSKNLPTNRLKFPPSFLLKPVCIYSSKFKRAIVHRVLFLGQNLKSYTKYLNRFLPHAQRNSLIVKSWTMILGCRLEFTKPVDGGHTAMIQSTTVSNTSVCISLTRLKSCGEIPTDHNSGAESRVDKLRCTAAQMQPSASGQIRLGKSTLILL